jgi:putative transposase
MSRKNLIRSQVLPYHITGRGNNRELFPCSMDYTWRVMVRNLNKIHEKFGVKIHAFVLMPNHFHLVMTAPQLDLGIVMMEFMRSTTKILNAASGRTGRVYGGPYHWSLIDDQYYLDHVLKYVYRNPVKAKMIEQAEDYVYSSIRGIIDPRFQLVPLNPVIGQESLIPNKNLSEYLRWLNQQPQSEYDKAMEKGLKRSTFQLPKLKPNLFAAEQI